MCIWLVSSVLFAALTRQPPADLGMAWDLDRDHVSVGGCLTLTIRHPRGVRHWDEATLRIGDARPTELGWLGPAITEGDVTHILVWQDPRDEKSISAVADRADAFQIAPIFREPGVLTLTLEFAGQSLGSKSVTVVAGTKDYSAVVRLLTLEVKQDKGADPKSDAARWMRCLVDTGGSPSAVNLAELDDLQRLARAFAEHPDWSEVAPLAVALEQAQTNLVAAIGERERARGRAAPTTMPVAEPTPELLNMPPRSRYAAALLESVKTLQRRASEAHELARRAASRPAAGTPSP